MKKKKIDPNTLYIPNFVLCDKGIKSAFARMCQNFQPHMTTDPNNQNNWLIIDNDTGQIITSEPKNGSHT